MSGVELENAQFLLLEIKNLDQIYESDAEFREKVRELLNLIDVKKD